MEQKQIKIAAVTDDGETISRHFGRAKFYALYTVQDGKIVSREQVEKASHHHGHHEHDQGHANVHLHDDHDHEPGHHHDAEEQVKRHAPMFEPLQDCDVLLTRGMGRGAHTGLMAMGVQPIITAISRIEEAVNAYLDGSIVDHPEKLH